MGLRLRISSAGCAKDTDPSVRMAPSDQFGVVPDKDLFVILTTGTYQTQDELDGIFRKKSRSDH
ncbi:MAG: hypothetical protein ACLU3U_02590 [Gallintestinimicrobium sp.]